MDRPITIAGNWKMYKTIDEAVDFIKELLPLVANNNSRIYLAVPFTAIKTASDIAKDSHVVIGAQNMNDASEGAFTGEIAGKMLANAGAKFVILGHSERRQIFRESNELINRKVKRALNDGLQPILCIGETLEEREHNQTEAVLEQQLTACLQDVTAESAKDLILAYEPVWAIGTNRNATPEMAEETHAFIRKFMGNLWGEDYAQQLSILYGGSAKSENAKSLLDQADIDGLLVGGASLTAASFYKIIEQI